MLGWGLCKARRCATEINGQINIEAPQGLSSSVLAYVDIQALSGFPSLPASPDIYTSDQASTVSWGSADSFPNLLVTREWTDQLEMPPLPWAVFWHPSRAGDAYSSPALGSRGASGAGAKGELGGLQPRHRLAAGLSPAPARGSWGWDLARMEPPRISGDPSQGRSIS